MSEDVDPHRVDPNGLPSHLENWQAVNWRVEVRGGDETKIPKRPASPSRNAKSNDASTWGSYQDAIENAAENKNLGFGFPAAQPGHPFTFIDVDIPEGGEWVPSYDILGGAIVERSPSNHRRIILTGDLETPEWWTNQSETTEDDETKEVKLFTDTGYVALTGDTLEGYGKPLGETHQAAFEEWLRRAWKAFNPDADRGPWEDSESEQTGQSGHAGSGNTSSDVPNREYTREEVESMLEVLPGNQHYDDWIATGFAVYDWDGSQTGKTVFENWSRTNSKWDPDESQYKIDKIWEDGKPGDDTNSTASVGTLVYFAKENGWEDPKAGGRDPREIATDLGDDEELPFWCVRELAVELDVLPRDALVTKKADDGGEYLGFPGPTTYNNALDAIEAAGLEHNRERATSTDDDGDQGQDDRTDDDRDGWFYIQNQYADPELDNKYARYEAVKKLRAEYDFVSVPDAGEFFVYLEEYGVFEKGAKDEIRRALESGLGPHYSQHEQREIVERIKAATSVDPEELNAGGHDEPLLCVGNGVLNVETREFSDHSPDYLFTRAIPWDYDPDAEAPNLEAFMDEITQREEDKLTMFEMVGHALHPEYVTKKFMVLFGDGDNGKTVFYKFVRELLGGISQVSGVELQRIADNRFASETILGSYANIAPDMASRRVSDLGDLKTLTGGEDAYWFEPKGERGFEAVNTATMMFGCNEPPVLPERSRAVKTRLVPVELPYQFVEDPDPENPLERQARPTDALKAEVVTDEEMSGFLNQALDGLERLMENGDVSLPETLDERLELYEQHSDPIKMFAVKCLENDRDSRVTKDDVYNTYVEFCRENGTKVANRNVFFRKLRQTTIAVSETRGPRPDRKTCLDNLTFTDYGQNVGAGVVFDDVDTEPKHENDDTDEGGTDTPLAALEVGRHDFTGEVVAVSAGEYNREAQGTIKGPYGTYIDFVVPGDNTNALEDAQGQWFTFERVKVRTDEDGLLEAVINDAVDVSEGTPNQQTGLRDSAEAVVADGGDDPEDDQDDADDADDDVATPSGEFSGTAANVVETLRLNDGELSIAELTGAIVDDDTTPDDVADAVALLKEKGRLENCEDDTIRLNT